jgi:hypothetical protein
MDYEEQRHRQVGERGPTEKHSSYKWDISKGTEINVGVFTHS